MRDYSHAAGCLIGGAIGDALGGPIEFDSIASIRRKWGEQGVTGYVELNRAGLAEFTDDTQMTLFTAEGILLARQKHGELALASANEEIHRAYLRWLQTQTHSPAAQPSRQEGWLLAHPELWKRKAPGNTCLSALMSGKMGTAALAINNSKGCGGVMRAAPVGIAAEDPALAFALGCASAAITHGHPSGYYSSGCLALMVYEILAGNSIREAAERAITRLQESPAHEETLLHLRRGVDRAESKEVPPTPETIERMGGGWVGEEALAISVYCALIGEQAESFERGVLLAVNHSGDCDSTGSITGNLLGARLGIDSIPAGWLEKIELRQEMENLARNLIQ